MKLEVGMYVRTKKGKIYKFESDNSMAKNGAKKYMVNCSYNIIDLIEVGDYVNGFPVIHKENDILKCGLLVQFKENEIKSILTKEMYSSVEYRVEAN